MTYSEWLVTRYHPPLTIPTWGIVEEAFRDATLIEREAVIQRMVDAYDKAFMNGCDPNGAWDCALEAARIP